MADVPKTKILTNDAITRKRWARDLFAYLLRTIQFKELMGTGSESPVQVRTELGKGEGDEITFSIRLPLSGQGVVGDNPIEGNEEKLRFRDFKMTIEELNHAVDTGGRMEEQRVPYDLAKEGKEALQEWWIDHLSDHLLMTLAGNTNWTIGGKLNFANTITEPDVYHHVAVGQADFTALATAEAALTASDTMTLAFLDRMKQRAQVPANDYCYRVRPLLMGGKKYYRVIMHNYVFDALRINTNIGQWGDLLRAANKLAIPEVEIEYNGLLISKTERLTAFTGNSNIYRTIMLGAQAACWAWGGAGESKSTAMSFVPYYKDAQRFLMIRGGGIFGVKKVRFPAYGTSDYYDYGMITGSSYATRLTA